MFLPYRTEAHDGKFRMGALGIIIACLFVHVLVNNDLARHESRLSELQEEYLRHKGDKGIEQLIKDVGGEGVLDDGTPGEARDSLAAGALARFMDEQKRTLFHRLALVASDFNPLNLITCQFVHDGWMHILMNMWFFYIVGVTMEKFWGTGKFIGLYLACGVAGNLAFLIFSHGANKDVPLVGASGAIAGMMGAFFATHGDAKVHIFWLAGFRAGSFPISARVYLGCWIAGQVLDGFLYAGQAGGVAYSAHIGGFLAGILAGKKFKGDAFYKKAYEEDQGPKEWARLVKEADTIPQKVARNPEPTPQDAGQVTALMNQGWQALQAGNTRHASEALFLAIEKAFANPDCPSQVLDDSLRKVLEASRELALPPGALYTWARRMEQRDWWQWAVHLYDWTASDASGATNNHSRKTSLFRAAVLRMEHNFERDSAKQGFEALLGWDPEGPYAEECMARLAALQG